MLWKLVLTFSLVSTLLFFLGPLMTVGWKAVAVGVIGTLFSGVHIVAIHRLVRGDTLTQLLS